MVLQVLMLSLRSTARQGDERVTIPFGSKHMAHTVHVGSRLAPNMAHTVHVGSAGSMTSLPPRGRGDKQAHPGC